MTSPNSNYHNKDKKKIFQHFYVFDLDYPEVNKIALDLVQCVILHLIYFQILCLELMYFHARY